jgi:hypothetical protein
MIVYVESSFVLELAYVRDEHESCERLLALAEESKIARSLPAFCLGEPYESWMRRFKQRRELHNRLVQEIGELSRSRPYAQSLGDAQGVAEILIQSGEEEKQRLDTAIGRIIETATIIPIERDTIKGALRLQSERSLSPQDSIVYSSVLLHLSNAVDETKCFLTKNSKDFASPDIYEDLKAYNCKLLTRFDHGLGYIQSTLKAEGMPEG